MIYKLLWFAALFVGVASILLWGATGEMPNFVAFIACLIVCVITFNGAWRN
jgi:hypothetical protein